MTRISTVRDLAKKIGATIDYLDGNLDFVVDAPQGHHWSCDPGLHGLVCTQWEEGEPCEIRYADVVSRMKQGVTPCVAGCEVCAEFAPESEEARKYRLAPAWRRGPGRIEG